LVIVPDFEITPLATELYVLGLTAHDGMFKNAIPRPEFRKPFDHGIGGNLAIWPYFHVIFDDGCRMDKHLQAF
jgi:hypothetical protein